MSFDDGRAESGRWHLLRKLTLLGLLVVAAALGLVILFRQGRTLPLTWFDLLADLSLGFLAGLGTRLILQDRHGLIQALASAALSIVGLTLLGLFTDARAGIGPLPMGLVHLAWMDWAHLSSWTVLQPWHSTMDLLDLAHTVIALNTSWIVLRAWKRRTRARRGPSTSVPRPNGRPQAQLARVSVVPLAPARQVRVPAGSRGRSRLKAGRSGRPLISTGAAALRGPARPRSRRWNLMHRRPEVQLAVHEEHRCPFCLEDVNRRDPRGVVECPICHTLHHKECWDVTGSCQVPHLNT